MNENIRAQQKDPRSHDRGADLSPSWNENQDPAAGGGEAANRRHDGEDAVETGRVPPTVPVNAALIPAPRCQRIPLTVVAMTTQPNHRRRSNVIAPISTVRLHVHHLLVRQGPSSRGLSPGTSLDPSTWICTLAGWRRFTLTKCDLLNILHILIPGVRIWLEGAWMHVRASERAHPPASSLAALAKQIC